MVTMSQRLAELRAERGMSRTELSLALGLPKNSVEKFETGRQTPSAAIQEKISSFFGVSLMYLRGETGDRTSMSGWMEAALSEPEPEISATQPRKVQKQSAAPSQGDSASIFEAFAGSRRFQDCLRDAIIEALRSDEGQKLLSQAIRRELLKK